MKPKISVIILNYNRMDLTLDCLRSIKSQTVKPYEVIVVDNNSEKFEPSKIRKIIPNVKIVFLTSNLGYSGGNNNGISEATGDWVLILNNDIVLDNKVFEHIEYEFSKIKNKDIAMCSLTMYDIKTKKVQSKGLSFKKFGYCKDITKEYEIPDFPCGGAALYRKDVLEQVKDIHGYFDNRFFLFWEDVDLGWRIQKQGYICKHLELPTIYHHHGGSVNNMINAKERKIFYGIRNRILMFRKNNTSLLYKDLFFLYNIVLFFYYIKHRKVVIEAIYEGINNF